ncbi:MAG TPA: hypothetical protein VN954_07530 [Ktedonobacteraceae bacterium]|nr:hypothetical protein [Ktedonobacteraceae bacterium]
MGLLRVLQRPGRLPLEGRVRLVNGVSSGSRNRRWISAFRPGFRRALSRTHVKIRSVQQQVLELEELISHLSQTKKLNEVEMMWLETEVREHSTSNSKERLELLQGVANSLAQAKEYDHLLRLIQRTWTQSFTLEYFIELLSLATGIIGFNPDISTALYESCVWVNTFLNG